MQATAMPISVEPPSCCSTRPSTPSPTRIIAAKSENCSSDTAIVACNLEARYDWSCASFAFSPRWRSTRMRSSMGLKLIGLHGRLTRSVTGSPHGRVKLEHRRTRALAMCFARARASEKSRVRRTSCLAGEESARMCQRWLRDTQCPLPGGGAGQKRMHAVGLPGARK